MILQLQDHGALPRYAWHTLPILPFSCISFLSYPLSYFLSPRDEYHLFPHFMTPHTSRCPPHFTLRGRRSRRPRTAPAPRLRRPLARPGAMAALRAGRLRPSHLLRAGPSRAEPAEAGPSWEGPSRAEPIGAESNPAGLSRAQRGRAEPRHHAGHGEELPAEHGGGMALPPAAQGREGLCRAGLRWGAARESGGRPRAARSSWQRLHPHLLPQDQVSYEERTYEGGKFAAVELVGKPFDEASKEGAVKLLKYVGGSNDKGERMLPAPRGLAGVGGWGLVRAGWMEAMALRARLACGPWHGESLMGMAPRW